MDLGEDMWSEFVSVYGPLATYSEKVLNFWEP